MESGVLLSVRVTVQVTGFFPCYGFFSSPNPIFHDVKKNSEKYNFFPFFFLQKLKHLLKLPNTVNCKKT